VGVEAGGNVMKKSCQGGRKSKKRVSYSYDGKNNFRKRVGFPA
jgi:hypothetical protein